MQIKRATEQDLDALVGFMQKVWRAHYPGIITVEQVEYMLREVYPPRN